MVEDVKSDKITFDGDVKEISDIEFEIGEELSRFHRVAKKDDVIDALKLVFDPEINVDVYNLGLIYKIEISKRGNVYIEMTLTSPTCPMAEDIPHWVADSVASVEGVGKVKIKLVWEPAWDLSKMTDEARFQLDIADMDLNMGMMLE